MPTVRKYKDREGNHHCCAHWEANGEEQGPVCEMVLRGTLATVCEDDTPVTRENCALFGSMEKPVGEPLHICNKIYGDEYEGPA